MRIERPPAKERRGFDTDTAAGGCGRLVAAWLAVAPTLTFAQASSDGKELEIQRLESPPLVDGILNEQSWSRATLVEDLHQIEPVEYSEPSQPTHIRLYYDDDALYVAARLLDSEANRITANVLRQGDGLADDDGFTVILDPYLDRRSGYRFRLNPNGVRWEGLYRDASNVEGNWDGIWVGAATRDGEGWTAEMAIPFKTISFDPNASQWGINFERVIKRNNESIGWVSRNREVNPSVAGTAAGFSGMRQGLGLDVVPSLSVREDRSYVAAAGGSSDVEPSLDLFYKITPSLNGALTINTDFSATEVDDRQVNLTRFSLFFPEKRDFFLQDADIFEFGRIGSGGFDDGGGNPALPDAAAQNARPFFSRRIGLSSTGVPVDIEYGGKVSGRVGRWNLGSLVIRQSDFEDVNATDVFVGRVAANVLAESSAGIIVTDGDPQSNLDTSLAGADFRYRNSRLGNGQVLEGHAWYQETDTEGLSGQDRAFGAGINLPNSTGWTGGFSTRRVERNFYPAVGFIDRTGIRDYALNMGYRHWVDDGWLRNVYGGIDAYRSERLDTGDVESESVGIRVRFENHSQDDLFLRFMRNRESLLNDFVIYEAPDGSRSVTIPRGDYVFNELRTGLNTGNQRKVSFGGNLSVGEFYDGDQLGSELEVEWRPSEHFRLGASYEVNEIELPAGDFTVRLTSLRAQIVFSSTLSWVNLIQYDNLSENVGINSRLHWIPQAGREGFIVLNHNLTDFDRNDSFHSESADAVIKFSYTFRF